MYIHDEYKVCVRGRSGEREKERVRERERDRERKKEGWRGMKEYESDMSDRGRQTDRQGDRKGEREKNG